MELKNRVWEIEDVPINAVKETVSEELGSDPELDDDRWIWTTKERFARRRVVVEISEGVVTETVYGSLVVRIGLFLGLLLGLYPVVFLLGLDVSLPAYMHRYTVNGVFEVLRGQVLLFIIGLSGVVLAGQSAAYSHFRLDFEEIGHVVETSSNYFLSFILAYILVIGILGTVLFFTADPLAKIGALVFPAALFLLYLFQEYKGLEWPVGALAVPLLGAGFSLGLVWEALLFSYVTASQQRHYQELAYENLRTVASTGMIVFFVAALLGAVMLVGSVVYGGCKVYESFQERKQRSFDSLTVRFVLLSILLISNVVTVASSLILVDVVQYGFSDRLLFPRVTSALTQGYWLAEAWNVSRTYISAYYFLFLLPSLALVGMWIHSIWRGIRRQHSIRKLLASGEEIQNRSVNNNIQTVIVDLGGIPEIRAGFSVLTLQKYVIVSKTVVNSLSESELEAVMAHESYHLMNHDWTVNLAATAFSGLVGGKNSLLVFYDYPGVETAADDYAARIVGEEALVNALDRLELLQAKYSSRIELSFWSTSVEDTGEKLSLSGYLARFYRLLFGDLVIDQSHLSLSARKERLNKK